MDQKVMITIFAESEWVLNKLNWMGEKHNINMSQYHTSLPILGPEVHFFGATTTTEWTIFLLPLKAFQ